MGFFVRAVCAGEGPGSLDEQQAGSSSGLLHLCIAACSRIALSCGEPSQSRIRHVLLAALAPHTHVMYMHSQSTVLCTLRPIWPPAQTCYALRSAWLGGGTKVSSRLALFAAGLHIPCMGLAPAALLWLGIVVGLGTAPNGVRIWL